MKILTLGDFHGTFDKKFDKLIEKEKIDLVVSNGDYFPIHFKALWFKHCYDTDVELWEVIGKKKYKEFILKDLAKGEKAIKAINSLKVPVITVHGNVDYTRNWADNFDYKWQTEWKWDNQNFFGKIMKKYKNITPFYYSYFKFRGYVFIGTYGSSNVGDPKSKTYKRNKKKLEKIFNKFKRELKGKKVIFVGHNMPYGTKLDRASKKAHKAVAEKHIGSKMIRELILKFKPLLYLGGHVHEAKGKDVLGKTICVNPGAAHEGFSAIINFDDSTSRSKIRKIKFVDFKKYKFKN